MGQMFCEKNEEKMIFLLFISFLGYEKRPAQRF